jgi:hypothetical protein
MFEYDVVISFAGEQRSEAEAIADCLKNAGVKVFYDRYEQANLWGKNLYEHLSEIYQNKGHYCLMLVSAAYASKVWPTHERRNAQARALSQKGEYILPVRFDETEIPGLPSTIGYLRFEEHGAQGICTVLLQKLQGSTATPERPRAIQDDVYSEPKEFWEQRRRLAETDILKKIWSKPRWRIGIRPTEFKKARFRDLEQCRQFIVSSCVTIKGWFSFPWFPNEGVESGDEWVAREIERFEPNRLYCAERSVLFRSAQFVHNRTFEEIPQLGGRVHALEILDVATAAFEFASRMAGRGILTPEAVITFDLYGLDGRMLTWPKDVFGYSDTIGRDLWCQDEKLSLARRLTPAEIESQRRELGLGVALEIFSEFGWSDPPKDVLIEAQLKRFGGV